MIPLFRRFSTTALRLVNCSGCGVKLQSAQQTAPGFIPSTIKNNKLICKRCHSINFNNLPEHTTTSIKPPSKDSIYKILNHTAISSSSAKIVHVIDALDFPNTLIKDLKLLIGDKHEIVLFFNKCDLLPPIKPGKEYSNYSSYFKSQLKKIFVNYSKSNNVTVILGSAKTGKGLDTLISQLRNAGSSNENVYLVGSTNVGKSYLLNALIKFGSGDDDKAKLLTVSYIPGTTLGVVGVPASRFGDLFKQKDVEELDTLEESKKDDLGTNDEANVDEESPGSPQKPNPNEHKKISFISDTPGIDMKSTITRHLTQQEVQKCIPSFLLKKRIDMSLAKKKADKSPQRRGWEFKVGTSVFVGGFFRIDYIGSSAPVTVELSFYTNQYIPLHSTNTKGASEIYLNNLGKVDSGIMYPPFDEKDRLARFPSLIGRDVVFKESREIVLGGIGVVVVDIIVPDAQVVGRKFNSRNKAPAPVALKNVFRVWSPDGDGIGYRTRIY